MEISIVIAVVLALSAGVLFGRRAGSAAGDRAQAHWDDVRASYVAAFPGARVAADERLQLVAGITLAQVVEAQIDAPGGVRPIRFVVGPEHGGEIVGMELPGWEFPMVIRMTGSGEDEVIFTAPGKWDTAPVMPAVHRLAKLRVHNLGPTGSNFLDRDAAPHTNISVSGPEQLVERLPRIVAEFIELQGAQPREQG